MKLGRVAEISRVFLEAGLGLGPDADAGEPGDSTDDASNASVKAARLRRVLERLGPTFVKFGQLLATRVDLFGEDYLRELRKLRAHVKPFGFDDAKALIEHELEQPLDVVFSEFPTTPAASASIAQVYRAQLRDTGQWVAVKVQRPKLAETLNSDLDVLMDVSQFIDRLVPAYHRSLVHHVASEYAKRARQEADFLEEARALISFSEVLRGLDEFRVPQVFERWCTRRILVMEWFDGVLLDQVPGPQQLSDLGVSPRALAVSMLKLQLGMSYEHGFVHGDTHPGNIVVLPDGHIGLLDFGLHGHVPRQLCDKMLELLLYQTNGQVDEAVAAFLHVFTPTDGHDLTEFETELRQILLDTAGGTAKSNRMTAQLVAGLRLGARYKLRAQSDLFIVLRNLTIVEEIVLTFCPDLDLHAEVRPILSGILQRRAASVIGAGNLRQLAPLVLLTLSQRPRLLDRLLRMERSFTEARNLGEFLQQEGVYDHMPAPNPTKRWVGIAIVAIAGVLGFVLSRVIG